MTEDGNDQIMHNPLQHTAMLEAEMVHQDKYGAITELAELGVRKKAIARALGLDIKTVRKYLEQGQWVPYQREPASRTVLSGFEEWIKARASEVDYNASVLFREAKLQGYQGGYETLKRFVRPLRTEQRKIAEATLRFETPPGQQGQVDWGSSAVWLGGQRVRTHFFLMTLGFSRRPFAQAFTDEKMASFLAGHEAAFAWFGGRPRELLYDNPRTAVLGREGGQVVLNGTFADFVAHYGFRPRFCQPDRARTKGKVESGVKYLKRNFLAGRRFLDLAHLNRELERWLTEVADVRIHGTTGERPIDRFAHENLIDISSVPPYRLETVITRQVPPDVLVSFGGNRYSVPWRYVGETVEVQVRGSEVVLLFHGEPVACHPKLAGQGQRRVDPSHLLGLFRGPGERPTPHPPRFDPQWPGEEVMIRDLAIYDQVAGLIGG
jgi:transposase